MGKLDPCVSQHCAHANTVYTVYIVGENGTVWSALIGFAVAMADAGSGICISENVRYIHKCNLLYPSRDLENLAHAAHLNEAASVHMIFRSAAP